MVGFAATVCVRVKVPFRPPNDGPHRMDDDAPERPALAQDATEEEIAEAGEAASKAAAAFASTVEENRIAASLLAETEVVARVSEALSGLGEVVDVVVEQVEEAGAE